MKARLKGSSNLSDENFYTIKRELKEDGSQCALSKEPKCYIRTIIRSGSWNEDDFCHVTIYYVHLRVLFIHYFG